MTIANQKGMVSTPADPADSKIMLWVRDVALKYDGDECLIWPFAIDTSGYGTFGRQKRKIYAHRYICEQVNGPPPNPKDHATHSCNNGPGGCVAGKHLLWKSNSGNQLDRYRASGKGPKFKLTPAQADEIRSLRGLEPAGATARRFGISEAHARQIQTGRCRQIGKPAPRQFTDDEVRTIRRTYGKTDAAIASEFSAHKAAIWRIRKGLSYKHVRNDPLNIQQRAEK